MSTTGTSSPSIFTVMSPATIGAFGLLSSGTGSLYEPICVTAATAAPQFAQNLAPGASGA